MSSEIHPCHQSPAGAGPRACPRKAPILSHGETPMFRCGPWAGACVWWPRLPLQAQRCPLKRGPEESGNNTVATGLMREQRRDRLSPRITGSHGGCRRRGLGHIECRAFGRVLWYDGGCNVRKPSVKANGKGRFREAGERTRRSRGTNYDTRTLLHPSGRLAARAGLPGAALGGHSAADLYRDRPGRYYKAFRR